MFSNLMSCALFLTTLLTFIVWKYLQKLRFWHHQNVQTASIIKLAKRTHDTHLHVAINEMYQKMCAEGQPFKAIEGLLLSGLVVQDQAAIEDILITQFENFNERGFYVNHKDPLLTNLGRVEYDLWKPIRKKFAASLTAAKMKEQFPTFNKVGDQLVEVLRNVIDRGNNVTEAYDLCQRYAIDIIGHIGFGLDCNCLRDPSAVARVRGMKAVRESIRPFYDQFARTFSKLLQYLDIKYHSKDTIDFFTNMVDEMVDYRAKDAVKRNDFMDTLLEARNDPDLPLTRDLIVGQVFGFFSAGFDNTSSSMSYVLYELAQNQEIQEKARAEINTVREKYGSELTYDSLKEMTYTYQIILESLRKYPVGHILPRTCLQPSTIRTSTTSIAVQANTTIIIPVYGIHHNPTFYPEPEVFRPERFDEQEMAKRPACAFLSFGDGPKTCVAQTFTKSNTIFFIAVLLSQFRFSLCERTPKTLLFDRTRMFTLSPRSDIFLSVDYV